jgi:hypothetical protein
LQKYYESKKKGGGNTLRPSDRRGIRNKILKELYDHHFRYGGFPKPINVRCLDSETVLAYRYLAEKSYINPRQISKTCKYAVSISAKGIDKIEMEKEQPSIKTITESPKKTSLNANQNKPNPIEMLANLGVFDMDKGYYE